MAPTSDRIATTLARQEAPWPPGRTGWYIVAVLTFAYLVSFVDRQIFSLLIEPIRQEFGITDTQVSLAGGFAFALLYTVAGIPIAWLADRRSRRLIIAWGASVWTVMTAFCGLSANFWHLFLARVGVGVGEAALTPSTYSILGDCFPPSRLARPMGVYMAGGAIGAGLALVVGGAAIAWATQLPPVTVPVIGTLTPWKLAFILAALPGILVVLLVLTIREPVRRDDIRLNRSGRDEQETSYRNPAFRYVLEHRHTYLPLFAGFAMLSLLKNAVLIWTPTLFVRTYGWSPSSIGYVFGLFLLLIGPLGAILGGWLADRWCGHGRSDAALRVVVLAAALCGPVVGCMPLMLTATGSLVLLAGLTLLLFVIGSVTPTAFQLVTPNSLRARVSAVALFLNNLLGIGLGPTVVALITDYGFGEDIALRYSIAIVGLIFAPLGALILWSGAKSYAAQLLK